MVEVYESDEEGATANSMGSALETDAVPDPVGVYDRPERTGGFSFSLMAAIVALLLLLLVAYFVFFI